jgi:hypothetical protein
MKRKFQILVVSVIVPLLIVSPVAASIDDMLDNVIAGVYTKQPGLIQSPTQSALSGGSLSFRLNNSPFAAQPLLTMNPPTMSLSCNGLDFDAGMLSMMNLDMFGDTLTNAGSSLAWGVMIGLVYSLPGIGEAFSKLQEWSRKIQGLMQSPCEMGKEIGASISSKWNTKATEREVATSGDDIATVYKDAKQHMKVSDVSTTFPFNVLNKTNIDSTLWPMISGYFGVMNIYMVDHNNARITSDLVKTFANACGTDPCSEDNIRLEILEQPGRQTLDSLMHGSVTGSAKGYACTMVDDECIGGISEVTITTEGIVTKIAKELRDIVQSYAAGGNAIGMTDTLGKYNAMVPQTQGMIKYAANIYKYGSGALTGDPSMSVMDVERIIHSLAEEIGVKILVGMFEQIEATIYGLSGSTENTTQKDELQKYLESIKSRGKETTQYIANRQSLINSANAMYDRYKTFYDMSAKELVKRVGPGVMIFGKQK